MGRSLTVTASRVLRATVRERLYCAFPMPILDINEIRRILPHRYPFLLVDRIVEMEPERIVGIKNVTANEPFFRATFPNFQ